MSIMQVFENIGISKINTEYTKPLDDKLSEIEENFKAVEQVSDGSARVINALNAHDTAGAVNATLQFFNIDDEAKELKKIHKKVSEKKVSVETATAAADGPFLVLEIVSSTKNEIFDYTKKINDLLPDIVSFGSEIGNKLKNIKAEADNWTLAEKFGTALAIRSTLKKAKKVKKGAEAVKTKLENFAQSIGDFANIEQ